jgi:glutathione peroxidase
MTLRQILLKKLYPFIAKSSRKTGNGIVLEKPVQSHALQPIDQLPLQLNTGEEVQLSKYKGKKVLLVNTASDCGYTGQYEELQKLQIEMPEKLVVIGFPANDFKAQEKAGDKDIAAFCQKNYGVTFPLAKKSVVVKKGAQNPVFKWLSDPKSNGWNDQEPVWNFTKYLINEQGELIGVFGPAVSPLEDVIRKKI